ncbi:hypothetical protein MT487_01050 [Lachnospiraceae bacterium NSJ-171]|nr:hypothetical protein [Lachnospiraceae bacterium NSJ-171]
MKTFGATLASMGITWLAGEALSLVVTEINNLVHAAENAREKSTELTKAWQEDNSSIDDSITKYKELHSKLSDTSLSTEEVEQAKESLISVQKDLIDKYGEEVKGIDLVNGKYSKQLGLLDQLSKKKAGGYVGKNYSNIQKDKKYLNEDVNIAKDIGTYTLSSVMESPNFNKDMGFNIESYLKKYDKLSLGIWDSTSNGLTGSIKLNTKGTREEIYDQISRLFQELNNDFGESNKDVNAFKTTLSNILDKSFDEDKINDAKNNIKKYAQAQILSNDNTRKLYSEATDAVEKYTNALSSGKNIKEAKENLDSVKNKVKDINKTVSGGKAVFDDLFNTIDTDSENTQKKVETVAEKVSFKQAWKDLGSTDDDALKDTQKNLLELAQSGKLTRDSFKNTSGATTWLQSLGLDIDEVIQKINNLKDVDEAQQLSSLKSGIKLIQDAFADKRDNGVAGADTLNSMESEFGNLSSWKNYKRVLGSTTSDLDACRKAQNELASEYIKSNNFLSKLVKGTGEVDEKTKQYYTSQLKELGIKNAKDVVDQQIVNRQKEIAQAKSQEIIDIKTSSIDLQNATQDEIQSLIDETEQLEGNTNALKLYLLQKMMSKDDAFDTEESVNNLINLANECNASETVINNLKNALKNLQDNGNIQLSIGLDFSANNPLTGTSIGNSLIGNNLPTFPTLQESVINDVANNQQNLNDEFQKNKDNALSENEKRLRKQNKKLQTKINTLLKDAASSNSKSNGSGSSKSNTSKEFNWIDVLIKRTERKVQKSIDRITDYASKKTKNNLFGKALKAYGKEEKTYANASDFYLKKFNKVKISKNAKKDAEWKRKIKNGKLDIQTITNEKLADKISKAQDYYDNYLDYQDKQTGAKQNALALRKQKLDDDIAYIEAKSDRIQRLSDSVQNRIDNNDALGLAISENSYKELIKYSKKQVKRWIDEKTTYAEYLSTLKRGSTEYIETEQKIADCDSKIQDAKKSQLEWNQTIAQMPLDKFERLGNVISSIITNLGNFNSLLESQGKKMTSSQILSEISVRNQSIANNDQDIAYNEGERFTNAIRSVINAKYDGVYGTKIVNKEADPIANNLRPLFEKLLSNEISLDDFYSKASEQTHMTVDALKQNKELSDILTSVSKLESENYSLMQEQEEYTDKLVDIEISKYQELRDEIEKVNDAKQKAIELTKKEIALQKELENRTNLIYRNGQYGYESDSSAVREKQNDLDNYYAQQQLDKLDDIIDKLGDLKNTLNYREGTEPIGDYKTNPSHLVEAAKRLIIGITGEVKGAYASGTTSAKGGLSLTGENGTELRVLNRGDGIIPAEITKNLMEFGVDPAKMIMDNLNKNIPDYKNIITPVNTSTDNSIHIDKVEMSGVNDVQSFMKELSHLTLDAQQRAYKK